MAFARHARGKHTNFVRQACCCCGVRCPTLCSGCDGSHCVGGRWVGAQELGARVPLIFHAAGQTHGIKSNSLVESVDIYPTLAALVCVCQCLASLLGPFQLKLLSHGFD
jgi:hypothetical protein|eukprot:COSAG01_NODE_7082_length_3361_cov_1.988964_5_plen_109_part_00